MQKFLRIDLCKKVKTAWLSWIERPAVMPVPKNRGAFLKIVPGFSKYISRGMNSQTPNIHCITKEEMKKRSIHVHLCSLDAKHDHLLVHGEAIARRLMKEKNVLAIHRCEQYVVNDSNKKPGLAQNALLKRLIIRVQFDDSKPDDPVQNYSFRTTQIPSLWL